jgi:phage baseplate assembly protein W
MAYVFETAVENPQVDENIGLGVRLTNLDSVFQTVYEVRTQVKENLKTLLLTRIGERYMQPTFGTNLLNIVFQPNAIQLKEEIIDILVTPINVWLPYISIDETNIVTAEDDPNLPHQVSISLSYSIQNFSTDSITIFANNDNTITVV